MSNSHRKHMKSKSESEIKFTHDRFAGNWICVTSKEEGEGPNPPPQHPEELRRLTTKISGWLYIFQVRGRAHLVVNGENVANFLVVIVEGPNYGENMVMVGLLQTFGQHMTVWSVGLDNLENACFILGKEGSNLLASEPLVLNWLGGRVWWWECAYLLLVLELAGAPSWRKVLTALLNARKHFGKLWSNEKSKPSLWIQVALESMVVTFLWCVWSMVTSLVHFGARIVVYGFAMFWYTWTFCIIYWCLCCVHFVVIVHWKKGTPNCTKTQPPHHAMAPLLAACSAHLCPVFKAFMPFFLLDQRFFVLSPFR